MYCCKCGAKNPDDSKFCIKCGEKLVQSEQSNETYNINMVQNKNTAEKKIVSGYVVNIVSLCFYILGIFPIKLLIYINEVAYYPVAFLPIVIGILGLVAQFSKVSKKHKRKIYILYLIFSIIGFAYTAVAPFVSANFGGSFVDLENDPVQLVCLAGTFFMFINILQIIAGAKMVSYSSLDK